MHPETCIIAERVNGFVTFNYLPEWNCTKYLRATRERPRKSPDRKWKQLRGKQTSRRQIVHIAQRLPIACSEMIYFNFLRKIAIINGNLNADSFPIRYRTAQQMKYFAREKIFEIIRALTR